MRTNHVWHESYDNVVSLGKYLFHEKNFTAEQLIWYFEKPWKWQDEYKEMQAFFANQDIGV